MIVVVGMSEKTFAQSRWIGIMPMEFNPSFAGNSGGHRIVALGGYEHSGGKTQQLNFYSYRDFRKQSSPLGVISYDNFIPKLASGVGVYFSEINSKWGSRLEGDTVPSRNDDKAMKAGINISPKISIRGKYTIAPSVGLNFRHYNYNFYSGKNIHYLDKQSFKSDIFYISTGLLFNTKQFYVGYAYFFAPYTGGANIRSLYEDKNLKEKSYGYIQAGYNFRKSMDSKASYTIQSIIMTKTKMDWNDLINNINFTFKYKKVLLGLSTSSFGGAQWFAGLGYQTEKIKIFYSQNLQYVNYLYSGELSCRILIPNKQKTFYQF